MTENCRTYWGSHGCHLPRGHDGRCWCECCACGDFHPRPPWEENNYLCVAGPPYYDMPNGTFFYGEDAHVTEPRNNTVITAV